MSDFAYCELCGQTVALTRERDETKPTVAELRAEIERLQTFLRRISIASGDDPYVGAILDEWLTQEGK